MAYKFSDKIFFGGAIKCKIMSKQQLSEELQKSITRKFEKQNVHSSFRSKIWGAGLQDMQLISNYNK